MTSGIQFTRKKQFSNCNKSIQEAERRFGDLTTTIRQKDQDIHESNEKFRQAEDSIVEMMERQLELNIQREREITEPTIVIAGLEQEISKQKADIAVLESQLQRRFTAPGHRPLTAIDIPPNWKLDREALIRIIEGSGGTSWVSALRDAGKVRERKRKLTGYPLSLVARMFS
jgi:hypothetical protein